MARITPYHQEKLASSRVGTPGVNESGRILGNSMAANSETLSAANLQAHGAVDQQLESMNAQNSQDISQAMVQHAALAKTQQLLNDEHTATAIAGQFAMGSIKDRADMLANKDITPDQYPDYMSRTLSERQTNMAQGLNANAAQHFNQITMPQIESFTKQSYSDKLEYGSKNAAVAQQNMEHDMVTSTTSPDQFNLLQTQLQNPEMQRNFIRQYGSQELAGQAIKKVLHDSAINAIDSNISQKPEVVEQWIANGQLDNLLGGKQIEQVRKDILSNKAANVQIDLQKQQLENKVSESKGEQVFAKALSDPKNPSIVGAAIQFYQDQAKLTKNPTLLKYYNGKTETLQAMERRRQTDAEKAAADTKGVVVDALRSAELLNKAAENDLKSMQKEVSDREVTKEGTTAINNFYTAMKELQPETALRGSYQEVQQLIKFHAATLAAAPYLMMPGTDNKVIMSALSTAQSGFERIRDGRTVADKKNPLGADEKIAAQSDAEKYSRAINRPASELLHRSLNPGNDQHRENVLNGSFLQQTHDGVAYWEKVLAKTLTPQEIQGVQKQVETGMLKQGAVPFKPPAPPEVKAKSYGSGQPAALNYYKDNRTPAMRQFYKDKYHVDPEDQLSGKH